MFFKKSAQIEYIEWNNYIHKQLHFKIYFTV